MMGLMEWAAGARLFIDIAEFLISTWTVLTHSRTSVTPLLSVLLFTGCDNAGDNWATEWKNSHTEGADWYSCGAAHSQPLNANMKAYTAWWLFVQIASSIGG